MSVGIVLRDVSAVSAAALAARAEEAGIGVALFPETGHLPTLPVTGRDPFAVTAAALRATSELLAGPGVAVTVFRRPRQMAVLAATIDEESGGRFLLGCGVSHGDLIAASGSDYPSSPLGHLRGYLAELREAAAREIGYGHGYPVLVGALGERMIECGARDADGVVLNWLTVEAAAEIATRVADLSGGAGSTYAFVRVGPAEALLRDAESYRSTLDNYRRHFERQGLGTTEEIVERTCVAGTDPVAIADRVAELHHAGIGTPCIYPVGMPEHAIDALLQRLARVRLVTQ